ncbi:MAG: hypothetical protein PW735_01965 [Acidobacteriaceae bacterium]|nr:hypothetical protein [Acidobacteriaceae bacterium]
MNSRNTTALIALFSCVVPLSAQTTRAKKHVPIHKPSLQEQISELQREMRQQHDDMQAQINSLKQQLTEKQAEAETASAAVLSTQQQAATTQAQALAQAQQNAAAVANLQESVASTNTLLEKVSTEQLSLKRAVESPLAIHYKGLTLTPGGFIAGESVWRQRAMHADIYTDYNLAPYPTSGDAHISEWVPSARQSRFSLLAEGKAGPLQLKAYLETDFLSAGTTSNQLQTNSYTLRMRQAWLQATTGRTTFNAGQMWTLATENKKAALAGQEALPLTIDNNFNVGTTWLRQMGYRVQHEFTPAVTLAVSLENAQYQFSANNAPKNFFFGAPGAFQGLNNQTFNYTDQLAPDILVKASFDPGWGHYEIAGIGRFFRDRYYPSAVSGEGARNDTKFGGGFVANARMPLTHTFDLGLHLTAGDGTGRYGASLLPDITVHPDGTLEPLRNAQGLVSLEAHPTKKLDLYGYAGTEYVQRTYYLDANGTEVGYGVPSQNNSGCNSEAPPSSNTGFAPGSGTCVGNTRNLTEGQTGFWYRPYTGTAGKLQFGAAYAYFYRVGWTGVGGAPKSVNNMVYTSVRYFLP